MDLHQLRAHAVSAAFGEPSDLATAVERLGFVQADPIRAPARAHDLILRPRVRDYRVGDLERAYPAGEYEEDLLYAYGFMPRAVWRNLHPRPAAKLTGFDADVLAAARARALTHPRDLDAQFGAERVVNAWGGQSRATKQALDRLHRRGLLRVAERRAGVRVYAPAEPAPAAPLPARMAALAETLAGLFAPARVKTLRGFLSRIAHRSGDRKAGPAALEACVADGRLTRATVDGIDYVWPTAALAETAPTVRFLAPFDPLVHDRERFEHLWGWAYRFEAYVPAAERIRGYYALPVLCGDQVLGWVNLRVAAGALHVDAGYVNGRPQDPVFAQAFAEEVERFRRFL